MAYFQLVHLFVFYHRLMNLNLLSTINLILYCLKYYQYITNSQNSHLKSFIFLGFFETIYFDFLINFLQIWSYLSFKKSYSCFFIFSLYLINYQIMFLDQFHLKNTLHNFYLIHHWMFIKSCCYFFPLRFK